MSFDEWWESDLANDIVINGTKALVKAAWDTAIAHCISVIKEESKKHYGGGAWCYDIIDKIEGVE